jgi:hypothetical protein
MLVVYIIRTVIWLTFLYLIVGSIVLIFWLRRFYRLYVRKHIELEVEVAGLKKHVARLEGVSVEELEKTWQSSSS